MTKVHLPQGTYPCVSTFFEYMPMSAAANATAWQSRKRSQTRIGNKVSPEACISPSNLPSAAHRVLTNRRWVQEGKAGGKPTRTQE